MDEIYVIRLDSIVLDLPTYYFVGYGDSGLGFRTCIDPFFAKHLSHRDAVNIASSEFFHNRKNEHLKHHDIVRVVRFFKDGH